MSQEFSDLARTIIDANTYMALGTADAAGHPWVSPVYFATEDYRHFHWVSSPDARHSPSRATAGSASRLRSERLLPDRRRAR